MYNTDEIENYNYIEQDDEVLNYHYEGVYGWVPNDYANSQDIDAYLEDEVFDEAIIDCFQRMGFGPEYDYHYMLNEGDRYPIEKVRSLLEQLEEIDSFLSYAGYGEEDLRGLIAEIRKYLDAILLPMRVKTWLREEVA